MPLKKGRNDFTIVATDPDTSSAQIERQMIDTVKEVKNGAGAPPPPRDGDERARAAPTGRPWHMRSVQQAIGRH